MNPGLKIKGNGIFKDAQKALKSLKLQWFCQCGNAGGGLCMYLGNFHTDLCMSFLCSVGRVHIAENFL